MKTCIVLVALLAACNLVKKTGDTADGAAATADSAAATATTKLGALEQKALSFLGAGPFEGAITMTVTNGAEPPETIVYMVKGTKMRFDAPSSMRGGKGYVIFDSTSTKITTVSDEKKTAVVMDVGGMVGDVASQAKKPVIDKTGKTDTVAGYSCELWKVTEDNGDKDEVCIAQGIKFPKMGKQAGWMSDADGFPLRAVTNDPTGKEKKRMEVTKIEKKAIDDATLQVPPGYRTMNMDDMMKGMGGAFARPR